MAITVLLDNPMAIPSLIDTNDAQAKTVARVMIKSWMRRLVRETKRSTMCLG